MEHYKRLQQMVADGLTCVVCFNSILEARVNRMCCSVCFRNYHKACVGMHTNMYARYVDWICPRCRTAGHSFLRPRIPLRYQPVHHPKADKSTQTETIDAEAVWKATTLAMLQNIVRMLTDLTDKDDQKPEPNSTQKE